MSRLAGTLGTGRREPQRAWCLYPLRIALFEPDIAPNAGAVMRLAACLGVAMDLIEPAGFVLDDRRLRRAGMDYLDRLDLTRHRSWRDYREVRRHAGDRIVLLTTRGETPYVDFAFAARDSLLLGRESAGVPETVHAEADARVRVPMVEGVRSLNVALTAAMVLGEALRQTGAMEHLR